MTLEESYRRLGPVAGVHFRQFHQVGKELFQAAKSGSHAGVWILE